MTIRSMTGFGQGAAESSELRVRVELRGLNNRFSDLRLRVDPELPAEEEAGMRRRILGHVQRGRVEATVRVERPDGAAARPAIHRELLEEVLAEAARLSSEQGLGGRLDALSLLSIPGMFRSESIEPEWSDAGREALERALGTALAAFDADRAREGGLLQADLLARARSMTRGSAGARARAEEVPKNLRDRLLQRLEGLAGSVDLDPARVAQEAAVLADRSDVTEELVRLEGHLAQMIGMLERPDGEPLGKRLEFLLQEIQREANTVCSKSGDLELTRLALAIKLEVEKSREQAQNLE